MDKEWNEKYEAVKEKLTAGSAATSRIAPDG